MQIEIKTNKNFTAAINRLAEKYGEKFEYYNGFHKSQLSYTDFIDNFIDIETVADATIDPNANSATKDIRTLLQDMSKPHQKLLCFNKIFIELTKAYGLDTANEWLEAEWNGTFYLHNANTSTFLPYCFAYDFDDLVNKGLFFISQFKTGPAKHFYTFNRHAIEFISWTSNRSSGAVGIPAYLVYAYWFWKKDVEDGYYIKTPEYYRDQMFQEFIYSLNQPFLRIVECSFTNTTIMDRPYLTEIFGGREYPDGTFVIDYIDEIIEFEKAFMEAMAKIREEQMMTFPVNTFSLLANEEKIKNDEDDVFTDSEFAKWSIEHNMKWNDSNLYIGTDVTSLSSCCRLINNFKEMEENKKAKGFINSIGGTSLKIGSVQVNTINLARLAKLVKCMNLPSLKDEEKMYFKLLDKYQTLSLKVLHIIRHIIKRNIEKGLLPNYTYGLITLEDQFCTQGITAMYETIREFDLINTDEFGNEFYSDEGYKFSEEILDRIKKNDNEFSSNTDYSINCEAVPGENANHKLCNKDMDLFETDMYLQLPDLQPDKLETLLK